MSALCVACSASPQGFAPNGDDGGAPISDDAGPGGPDGGGGPVATPVSPKRVSTSTQAGEFESEDQIAVAPDGTIAIVWTAFPPNAPYMEMDYAFSTDDGQTFSPPQAIDVPAPLYPGDPSIDVDSQGNFYAAIMGLDYTSSGDVDYTRVYAARAPRGSLAFGPVVEASDPNQQVFIDHPKIFATHGGAVLINWNQAASSTATATQGIVASTTNFSDWKRTVVVNDSDGYSAFYWFCQSATTVYMTFLHETTAGYFVDVASSPDQGASWSPSFVHASGPDTPASIDPGCAASGDDVWVMYSMTNADPADDSLLAISNRVRLAHSSNGGASFAPAVDVLDTAKSKAALLPILAGESGGALDVTYIAGNAAGDHAGSVRNVRITGDSLAPSDLVDQPLTFQNDRTGTDWVGDYFGSVWHAGGLYVAYPRNDSGYDHIWFAKIIP